MKIIEASLAMSNKIDQKDTHNGSDTDNCRLVSKREINYM